MKIFTNKKEINYWLGYEMADFHDAEVIVLDANSWDIHPQLYGEPDAHTYTNIRSAETFRYMNLINQALVSKKKIIGFGTIAQLICVMAGGKLLQHVAGHYSPHSGFLTSRVSVRFESNHHQVMNPYNLPDNHYKLIGVGIDNFSSYQDFTEKDIPLPSGFLEPEIVYFKRLSALSIQPRQFYLPTHLQDSKEQVKLIIDNYVNGKIKDEKDYRS